MTNFKLKLAVNPGAKLIFVRLRSIPFALRELLKKELDWLEEAWVIGESLTATGWLLLW